MLTDKPANRQIETNVTFLADIKTDVASLRCAAVAADKNSYGQRFGLEGSKLSSPSVIMPSQGHELCGTA